MKKRKGFEGFSGSILVLAMCAAFGLMPAPSQCQAPAGSADTQFSADQVRAKLPDLKAKREQLGALLDEAKSKGIDVSYPRVAWAVNALFERMISTDLDEGQTGKASYEEQYVLNSTDRAIAQIKEWIEDPSKQIKVPQVSIANLQVRDGEFYEGDQPVFLMGAIADFGRGQPLSDLELYSDIGFNETECGNFFGTMFATPNAEGELSAEWVDLLKRYMEETDKDNIAVWFVNELSEFAPWAAEKYPSIFTCGTNFLAFCITNPQARKYLGSFLKLAVPSTKDYPSMLGYCLANEPQYNFTGYCDYCQAAWKEYLKQQYQDIAKLNESWGTNYRGFDEVGTPPQGRPPQVAADNRPSKYQILKPAVAAPINGASEYDWEKFNQYLMTNFFTFMRDTVKGMDKRNFCSWKSEGIFATWGEFGNDDGMDREEIGKRGDLNEYDGPSSVPIGYWPSPGGDNPEAEHKYAMYVGMITLDLMKSLAPDKPLFNSEWQDLVEMRTPDLTDASYRKAVLRGSPDYVRTAIWLGYLHGNSAGIFWTWTREMGKREWDMLDLPEAMEAAGKTALDLRRLAPEVIAFHKAPRQVAILFSMPSKLHNQGYIDQLNQFQSQGLTPEQAKKAPVAAHCSAHERELRKVHGGLYFCGINYGFITEEQIKQGGARQYKLVIIPRADFVSDEAYEGIKSYVKAGGRLLVISDSLNYDEHGKKRDTSELFSNPEDVSVAGFPLKHFKLGEGEIYLTQPLCGDQDGYLAYLVNINKTAVSVKLRYQGKDIDEADELINNREVYFPVGLQPMDPMIIKVKTDGSP